MKDRKYITDFVPEVCKGIKNKLDQLEDDDAWLRKENARLREALKNIGGIEATWEPCPYDAYRVAFMTAQALAEEALYPYGSYLEQLSLKEGNDE